MSHLRQTNQQIFKEPQLNKEKQIIIQDLLAVVLCFCTWTQQGAAEREVTGQSAVMKRRVTGANARLLTVFSLLSNS